ncbi:MAG: deoxyribose-phosphate aldolase [Planctomycetota bacterium]|jgi:deoxyribose-phosphate aldolase
MMPETKAELAKYIDHAFLKATTSEQDVRRVCAEAVEYGFWSVCFLPRWMSLAADILHDKDVKVDGVAGFPFGTDSARIKAAQAEDVIMAGADEVDMVADLASIMKGDRKYLTADLKAVLKVCRSMTPAVPLKVIIEAAALTMEQKVFACKVAQDVGVDFIKTSTGLHPAGGAAVEDVKLMAETAPKCRIKAAGGIRTAKEALDMIEAGASRIGTSASVQIVEGLGGGES